MMRKIILAGKISSLPVTIISIDYGISQDLVAIHPIPHPANVYWSFMPFLLLVPLFLVMTVCLDLVATENSRKWTTIASGIATINCTLTNMAYFFRPRIVEHYLNWQTGDLRRQVFETLAILISIQFASCYLLSASAFICSFTVRNSGSKRLYRGLVANGLFLPLLAVCSLYPRYYYLASGWMVAFSVASLRVISFFKTEERKLEEEEKRIKQPIEWVIR